MRCDSGFSLPAVGVPGARIWRDEWAASFAGLGQTTASTATAGRANAPKAAAALIRQGVEARYSSGRDRDDGFDVTAPPDQTEHDREDGPRS
jgi:hypothetical protein